MHKIKIAKALLTAIFSLLGLHSFSQDTIFIYDVASKTLSYRLMPTYNLNAVSDSTNPSFGVHGVTNMPTTPPINTYPASKISLIEKASDYYSTFNFPFTSVALIRYGFNIAPAVIGRRALLVSNFDVSQGTFWRNLSDANPFYENGSIQYGFQKLTPIRYYTINKPSYNSFAVVEVAENIGDYSGYFGLAFDTTSNAYDSLLLYNISYPIKDMFNFYPDSMNGDTLYMKYGYIDGIGSYNTFQAYKGGNGEYESPYFDAHFRLRGVRWSASENDFIGRKGFYFLKYITDSLATKVNEVIGNTKWKIYPNPASKKINILLSESLKQDATFIISNILGKTIETISLSIGERTIERDISGLANGIYIVTIKEDDKITIGKFVKQ